MSIEFKFNKSKEYANLNYTEADFCYGENRISYCKIRFAKFKDLNEVKQVLKDYLYVGNHIVVDNVEENKDKKKRATTFFTGEIYKVYTEIFDCNVKGFYDVWGGGSTLSVAVDKENPAEMQDVFSYPGHNLEVTVVCYPKIYRLTKNDMPYSFSTKFDPQAKKEDLITLNKVISKFFGQDADLNFGFEKKKNDGGENDEEKDLEDLLVFSPDFTAEDPHRLFFSKKYLFKDENIDYFGYLVSLAEKYGFTVNPYPDGSIGFIGLEKGEDEQFQDVSGFETITTKDKIFPYSGFSVQTQVPFNKGKDDKDKSSKYMTNLEVDQEVIKNVDVSLRRNYSLIMDCESPEESKAIAEAMFWQKVKDYFVVRVETNNSKYLKVEYLRTGSFVVYNGLQYRICASRLRCSAPLKSGGTTNVSLDCRLYPRIAMKADDNKGDKGDDKGGEPKVFGYKFADRK